MTGQDESLANHIQVLGRNVLVTPAMKQHAMEKLAKIGRFQNHILDIHVTMDIENLDHKVVLVAKFDHFKIKSEGHSSDMYASIDLAIGRMQNQLRKWKDQIQDHTKKKRSMVDIEVELLEKPYSDVEEYNAEIAEANAKRSSEFTVGKVTGKKSMKLKELNTREAIVKMELSNDDFLVYRSEEDKKLRVIYRRKDENYGIIQPE
jgi:putative sigma-54 modulation protein